MRVNRKVEGQEVEGEWKLEEKEHVRNTEKDNEVTQGAQ